MELHAIPHLAVTGMITVLLASLRVAAYSLDVTVWTGADPDRSPRRRNYQGLNSRQFLLVANRFSIRRDIASCTRPFSTYPWSSFRDIPQPGQCGGIDQISGG